VTNRSAGGGIYGNSGIRWRQKFISKCHVKTNNIDEPIYACIFCIEENKTVEEHDATVFFSVTQLFRHLAKHPRPLPAVAGISTIYGPQPPTMLDFDIHFTIPEPASPSQYSMIEIAPKVATRPSAHAITTHHPKSTGRSARDPEGNPTLNFAAGARIVGITFPDRFHGQWCVGYHDGDRGSFPANTIVLEMPTNADRLMNAQSSLIAYSKWEFKPKEAKDGGWLRFSKGERISNIGYAFQDHWCWSGQNSKGKWGLFPAAFVDNLQDASGLSTTPTSVKSSLGGFGRMPSFPLRRNHSSRNERAGSVRSVSRLGGIGEAHLDAQPGLEVVRGFGR